MKSEEVATYCKLVSGWDVRDGKAIAKTFSFADFSEALAFVNHVGEIAESEGHHPDIRLFDYKNVEIVLSTHAIGGLSVNDFIVASKIDALR